MQKNIGVLGGVCPIMSIGCLKCILAKVVSVAMEVPEIVFAKDLSKTSLSTGKYAEPYVLMSSDYFFSNNL